MRRLSSKALRELLAYKDKDLVRKKELGDRANCLEGIHERAKTVFALFSRIDESKLERLTDPTFNDNFRNPQRVL